MERYVPNTEGMYMANRDVEVRTTTGHVLQFKKDKPLHVPVDVRPMLINYGILPVSGEVEVEGKTVEVKAPPPSGRTRDEKILDAVNQIKATNNADDFTAGGIPNKAAIERITGFEVNVAERNAAWKQSKLG